MYPVSSYFLKPLSLRLKSIFLKLRTNDVPSFFLLYAQFASGEGRIFVSDLGAGILPQKTFKFQGSRMPYFLLFAGGVTRKNKKSPLEIRFYFDRSKTIRFFFFFYQIVLKLFY